MEPYAGTFPLPEKPNAPSDSSPSGLSAPLYVVAALSALAALSHLWMMPVYMSASTGYGAFFAALALAQGLYGVALVRWPARAVALLGAWGTLAVFVFYVVERVARDSLGSHATHAGGIELLAMMCTAAQLGLLIAVLMDTRRTLRVAEALSFGISLVYLWEAPNRFAEWWGFGVLFVVVGVGGAIYCLLLPHLGGNKGFLLVGISANLLLVGAWLATRAVGVPYAETGGAGSYELRFGATEGVGVGDLSSTTMEVSLAVLLATLALRGFENKEAASGAKTPSIKEKRICHRQEN